MKVAVGIAAYNAEAFVADAIASLLQQRDAANLDIIVVDDGSTDATAEIVSALGAEAPEIRLIRQENLGITRTRNVILKAIAPDTDYFTSLDSDDLLPDQRIKEDLAFFAQNPDLEFVYGNAELFRETDASGLRPLGRTLSVRGVQLGCGFYRMKLVRQTGFFDERFQQGEDTDFLLRMVELQPKYKILPYTRYYYRRHANNITRDTRTLRRDLSRALLYSAKRRKEKGLGPVPADIFDAKNFALGIDW